MENIKELYFNWMCDQVDHYPESETYTELLYVLNDVDFEYLLEMDGNRYEDGIDLRYRFGNQCGYSQSQIAYDLDDHPCSILEMMVALAIRCEDLMANEDAGNRTGEWFWGMVRNLGLGEYTDIDFDEPAVREILYIFISREYSPDGSGGLFTTSASKNREVDMTTVRIWFQAMWYLDDIIEKKED